MSSSTEAAEEAVKNSAPLLNSLEGALQPLTRLLATLGVVGMLMAASATVVDILLRATASRGVIALNEIVAMCFAVAIAACIPAGLASGVNLKIDLLSRWITGRVAAWLDAFGALFLCIFFALLAQQIGVYAGALANQNRVTVILGWPQAPFMYAIVALVAIGVLVQLVITANAFCRAWTYQDSTRAGNSRVLGIFLIVVAAVLLAVMVIGGLYFPAIARWSGTNPGKAVLVAFAAMWILMLAQVPLAALTGLIGIIGAALFIGFPPALSSFATGATGMLTNNQISTLPLFLMMGSFAAVSGMADDLYKLAHAIFGKYRGGLAYATIGSCAGFGALTGSSLATAATVGRVAIPEMRERGYSPALATGVCAAGGTLGPLVPPGSGPIIVFALLTEASIGQLFIASVGPAILGISLYLLTIAAYVRISPASVPQASGRRDSIELRAAIGRCIPVGLLVFGVMGGLYLGFFTDTESAAVGAIGAFVCALLRGKLNRGTFFEVMAETTSTTAMVYGLIIGAQIFSFFVGASGLTETATAHVSSLKWAPAALMTLILVGYLALGMVMESFAVMIITVPIVTPLVLSMGYDIVWWGIIMLCVVETGMIHPPFGLNVFVLKGMTPDVSLWTIYKGVTPFVISDLIKLALMVAFPAITLWLVHSMAH
jgi:C4-dicarboxylate transporter, DctM subunit